MKDEIKLSDDFTYGRLVRFTLPTIAMMIFLSVYGVVDGIFVSNFVGETPFAALNLIMPYIMVFSTVGFMLGAGGSALVASTLGAGDRKKANEIFSLVVYVLIALEFVLSVVGAVLAEPAALLLGADGSMLGYCVQYAQISFISMVPFSLQQAFQSLFITAEKPRFGLYVTIGAGVANMALDCLFVGVLGMGLPGAAFATVVSEMVGGFIPLVYFFRPNSSLLRLGKTKWYGSAVLRAAVNGSSEFMTNVSTSLVNMLYNFQLMKYAGQSGVAAYGVIVYTNFIFMGIFGGYSMGVAPIAGFKHGAADYEGLGNVFKKSVRVISAFGVTITLVSTALSGALAMIFTSRNGELTDMTSSAIKIYSLSYLFSGFNLFGSSFFTALNNGAVSALISFMRVLVLQVVFVLLLPLLLGLRGIWLAIVMAELCALFITAFCLVRYRKRYRY